jgi:HK97 gp10 family phage protein
MTNDIDRDIYNIVSNLKIMAEYLDKPLREKTLLRKASRFVIGKMKTNAPVDTGAMRDSIGFLPRRRAKRSVFIGPNAKGFVGIYPKMIEYGYVTKSGKRVAAKPFAKPTYEETKEQVLTNLKNEITKEFAKAGKAAQATAFF